VLSNYVLRFIRWQSYLSALGYRIPAPTSLGIYLAGFALTTTPGKVGETTRSLLLEPLGVGYPASLAAFFSERLSDLICVLLITAVGMSVYQPAQPLVLAILLGVIAALWTVRQKALLERWQALLLQKRGKLARIGGHAVQVLLDSRRCHEPALLARATLLGIAGWGAEACAFYYSLHLLGSDISWQWACFIYTFSILVGVVSFLPGGLGSSEAVMIGLLVLKGMPHAEALAVTVFTRLTTLWFAVALGLLCLSVMSGRARR